MTGSAHCYLARYWSARLGKSEMTAYQASSRWGVVRVRLSGERVILGGQAVTVMVGELRVLMLLRGAAKPVVTAQW